MKYGNKYFIQVTRSLFNDKYKKSLSRNAKWLYVVLKEQEHKFTSGDKDYFYRADTDLAEDADMKLTMLKSCKKEIVNSDLVETWKDFPRKGNVILSKKLVTYYRMMK